MTRSLAVITAILMLFAVGCAKKVIHSTPPAPHYKQYSSDKPEVSKPILKIKPYTVNGITYYPHASSKGYHGQGLASWYGDDFHGKLTANGEIYDMHAMTAAHRTLPMGTVLKVRDVESGRSVVVRVNDRGPFADPDKRIIDLSYAAAQKLGIVNKGLTPVNLSVVDDMNIEPVLAEEVGKDAAPAEAEQMLEKASHTSQDVVITETSTAQEHYYIQVGAFTDKLRAEAIKNYLLKDGYSQSRLENVIVNEVEFFRVQAGYFLSLDSAEEALQKIRTQYPEGFIIAD
ncbi:septal ring lytic transglycosylase RlpA family protein [Maridesulfovibrio bastinii]|uniref:septal ring lytic transglycosylase RlpA family protein n=1 Tax=Maridesulfovibrio bastinii TaxID=47157 RepID=UPI00041B6B95|nr:septal ring lytic transglycosylase RlpA family protein [Maridesulfovibrio bastinii]